MAQLKPELKKILDDFEVNIQESVWDCHGTLVIKHRTLEEIAARAKIVFDAPQVLEANGSVKVAALCVTGRMGDSSAWSIGEAAPGNNKNAYPFAMAEKRAKDRVILKLVGLSGFVYSEDEADDFKEAPFVPIAEKKDGSGSDWELYADELAAHHIDFQDDDEFVEFWKRNKFGIDKMQREEPGVSAKYRGKFAADRRKLKEINDVAGRITA